jgi:thiol:disulfide interchange protein DsbD
MQDIFINIEQNLFLTFILVFTAGLLTSLTPCIFPMLPITISVIGTKKSKSTLHSFFISLIYVFGISVTYSILGLISALSGSLFGSLLQNTYFIIFVSIIFLLMGLSMFDLFLVQIPLGLQNKLSKIYKKQNKESILGVATMGLISGLIATPCVGPVIVSLLTYVAQTKNLFLGFWLLFVFALGMGSILIIFGTFSNKLINMPKAGNWMEEIKKLIGFVMFGISIYYIRNIIPEHISYIVFGILLIILGSFISQGGNFFLRKSVSIIIISLGIYFFIGSINTKISFFKLESKNLTEKKQEKINWLYDEKKAFEIAKKENKYLMIDFYADWCPSCMELEKFTYTNSEVINKLNNNFISLKIDLTNTDENKNKLIEKYQVVGLPLVLFVSPKKGIIKEYSLTGFENPEEFIKRLDNILNK